MRRWLEEKALRLAYWLLWKVRQGDHAIVFHDLANDAQRSIAEIVTVYYKKEQRTIQKIFRHGSR